MSDYTTRRTPLPADQAGKKTVPRYVNPQTVIDRWRAGEVEGRTWAIREYVYLQIKARQSHGQEYFESQSTIAAKFGGGLTAEDVHAATKGSKLVVRMGTDGDRRRPWAICTDPDEKAALTSGRKPQPPQRRRRRTADQGAPDTPQPTVQEGNMPSQTSSQRTVRLEESSRLLDKTSRRGTPQPAGQNVHATENHSTTPPFENKDRSTTAPHGADGAMGIWQTEDVEHGDVITIEPAACPLTRPSDNPPARPPSPGARPQAGHLDDLVRHAAKSRTTDDAYVELVRRLKSLNRIAIANSSDAAEVDDVAKQLAHFYDCGWDCRRQALCYVLGEARGGAILRSIDAPAGHFDHPDGSDKEGHCSGTMEAPYQEGQRNGQV